MISKRTENGTAVYYAIEEFSGSVKGKNGGFTLVHKGHMSKESQSKALKCALPAPDSTSLRCLT